MASAERALGVAIPPAIRDSTTSTQPTGTLDQPSTFANGRYEVKRVLGEGGKKMVYLAHDT
ncbi:MAG: hypothetical protein J4N85_06905, partial [Chloroflexi bacterium]|nr:hypothetical protein [Chloroflexota bacterium]